MRTLRDFILPMALALILVPVARAADDEKTASDKKGEEQTIRGVISEVTVLGETDIDYTTRKAITAEATFVTVIGHPSNHDATHRDGEKAHAQASADRSRDQEVKRTANASGNDQNSAQGHRHRLNVYVVAVTPRTKVSESKETGKAGSESIKEEAYDLDKLEIGDRVEVSFNPKVLASASGEKAETHPANQKHGRHRTVFGTATAISLLPEHMEGDHSAEHETKK